MLTLPIEYHDNSAGHKGFDLDAIKVGPGSRRALIVDDDPDTVDLIKIVFRNAGMDVIGAFNGNEALEKCTHHKPSVILLDLMMPGMDGWETYDRLRKVTNVPVIVVSADGKKENIVKGLNLGFDDYVTKPFFPPELVARVNTVLRRSTKTITPPLQVFSEIGLRIDFEVHDVELKGKKIHLSSREFAILEVLAKKAPRMARYEEIAKEVWGADSLKIRNRMKYLVYLLRQKMEQDPENPQLILNRESLGYQLNTGESPTGE
jgi:DNA-binding response OmpR family regulator